MSGDQEVTLGLERLRRFVGASKREAVEAVTARFYMTFPTLLFQFGEQGRQATRKTSAITWSSSSRSSRWGFSSRSSTISWAGECSQVAKRSYQPLTAVARLVC